MLTLRVIADAAGYRMLLLTPRPIAGGRGFVDTGVLPTVGVIVDVRGYVEDYR